MKDEALKLALEALEYEADKGNDNAYQRERDAIKQALAQPDQEPVGTVGSLFDENVILRRRLDRDLLVYTTPPTAQPEQEPVAWVEYETGNHTKEGVAFAELKLKEKNT
jgi:hypothetical protein